MTRIPVRRSRHRLPVPAGRNRFTMEGRVQDRWTTMGAIGLGALLMYFLDPRAGRRRRALMRDRLVRFAHAGEEGVATTWRDARNRWSGLWAEMFRSERAPASDMSGLQGRSARIPGGHRFELMQTNWSPSARASVAMAGTASALYGLSRRDTAGAALGVAGLAVVARAWLNRPWTRLTGIAAGHRAVDVTKTIRIGAPLERVFRFWSNYPDFPRYTSHVREVLEQGDGRSRWSVTGPAGISLSWDAVVTKSLPNRELAWRTEPGSAVQHAGTLKFRDNGDGTTTVHVRIGYNPPGGAIGHGAAALVGSDLNTLLEKDLVRIKSVLEEGTIPADAQRPSGTSSMPALKSEQLEQ